MKKLTLLLVVAVFATTAGTAFAQGDEPYQTNGENVAGAVQGQNSGPSGPATDAVAADSGGSLPFTGLDVALILAVGGVLMAVGLGTRRLTRPADAA
jgi:hypothetical protein